MRSIVKSLASIAFVGALPCTASATGMIAQTFSQTAEVFRQNFAVAAHPRGAVIAAVCSDPSRADPVLLYEVGNDEPVLTLTEPGGRFCGSFGTAVAVLGNEILIGAPRPRNGTSTPANGAVYVFDGTTGALLRTLQSPASAVNGARFGNALLVSRTDVFVAAPGVTDTPFGRPGAVYRIDPATGAVLAVYTNPEATFATAFGAAFAISGDRLLVGDPDGRNFIYDGVVHVFDVASGAHLRTIEPVAPATGLQFGTALGVAGGRVAVGAPSGPDGWNGDDFGAVYLFDESSFAHVGTVLAPEVSRLGSAGFGLALGAFGEDLLVGAPEAPIGLDRSGAAYLVDPQAGTILSRFHAPGGGMSLVAVDGRVLVGARFQGELLNLAYLFETCASLGEGAACDDGDGCVTGDVCAAGRCVAGAEVVACEGRAPPCRVRGCEPATGACHTERAALGAPCFEPPYQCPDESFCNDQGVCSPDADPDPDGDLICSAIDLCPQVANPSQLDSDGDERGDVCDASDASLVVHATTIRWNRGGRPGTGRVSLRGELLSRADLLAFDPDAGVSIRVEDGSDFTQVFVWPDAECDRPAGSRFGCEHRGRPASRFELRPLARQVDGRVVYRFRLEARALDIERAPEGPFDVTLTTQPARAVSGYDRVGQVTGCRNGRTRVTCRVNAGAP
jgi:outer membrane protein assembly factor BamB